MSTEYIIAQDEAGTLSVDEGSNRFSINIGLGPEFEQTESLGVGSFSTEELIGLATRILRVAAYWSEPNEQLMKAIEDAGKVAVNYSVQLPPLKVAG